MYYLNDLAMARKYKFKNYRLNPIRTDLKFHLLAGLLGELPNEDNLVQDILNFRQNTGISKTFIYSSEISNPFGFGDDFTICRVVKVFKIIDTVVVEKYRKEILATDKYKELLEADKDKELLVLKHLSKAHDEAIEKYITNTPADKIRSVDCAIILDNVVKRIYVQDTSLSGLSCLEALIDTEGVETSGPPFKTVVPDDLVSARNYEKFLTSFYLNPFEENALLVGDKVQMGSSYLKVSATGAVKEVDLLFDKVLEGEKVKELCILKVYGQPTKKAIEDLEFSSSDGVELQTFKDLLSKYCQNLALVDLAIGTSVTVRSAKNNTYAIKNNSLLNFKKKAFEEAEDFNQGVALIFMLHSLRMAYLTMNDCYEKFLTERADQLGE